MRLKALREKHRLSQSELASKIGVTQGFISHLELGIREPTLKLARKIAAIFGVSVDELFDETKRKAVGE